MAKKKIVYKRDEKLLKRAKTKLTIMNVYTIFTLFIGLSVLIALVSTSIDSNDKIKMSPIDETVSQNVSTLYILTACILLVSLIVNLLLYRTIKKISNTLLSSNQDLESIKEEQKGYHQDDIKEIVATRDMLLYKLIGPDKK